MKRSMLVSALTVAALSIGWPLLGHAQFPPCGDATAPQCDGTCPVGEACTEDAGSCSCTPAYLDCSTYGLPPACIGLCLGSGVCQPIRLFQ